MDNYRDLIIHSGIKGMKWGVRNQETLRRYGLLEGLGKRVGQSGNASGQQPGAAGGAAGSVAPDAEYYDNWDDLPADPNGESYTIMGGFKIQKVEDGTAVIHLNGELINGKTPQECIAKAKDLQNRYGKKKERFSQLSDDPDSRDYVEIQGEKVKKAEDGTAYIHRGDEFIYGDTPGAAIKKAKAHDRRQNVQRKLIDSRIKRRTIDGEYESERAYNSRRNVYYR